MARQFDPALHELLFRATGDLLGETSSEDVAAHEVPVVARLTDVSAPVAGLRVVSRFADVVTGRVALGNILEVRSDPNVVSLKASAPFTSALDPPTREPSAQPDEAPVPVREMSGRTGAGVIVAVLDWGCDFAHCNFRDEKGCTRLLRLWDQRGGYRDDSPTPFGYGRDISREAIDAALATPDPYAALEYDPDDADASGLGSHGTHVMDIAAGNGRAHGGGRGVAPKADLVFVHLAGNDTYPEDNLGDSVRLLEAVRWVLDLAGPRPVVVNLSLGKTGGPHDGSTLVERALDAALRERNGRAICMSTGNYYGEDLHGSGRVAVGGVADIGWRVPPHDDESAEMEVWYHGNDTFAAELVDPHGRTLASAALGENAFVRDGDAIVGTLYHRACDPNNLDNQLDVILRSDAPLGDWTLRLHGVEVHDGRYDVWVERADPAVQARLVPGCATQEGSTGTIANGRLTIACGAFDARIPGFPIVAYSSVGPTRDSRAKPEVSAPGAGVRAARSSQRLVPRPRDETTVKSGTSMAAPYVSGTVALLMEASSEPLAAAAIKDILMTSARTAPPFDDADRLRYGAGRVDPDAALRELAARQARATGLSQVEQTAPYGSRTLRRGDRSEDVARFQADLRETGFALVGPSTWIFGRELEWAVREFQLYARMSTVAKEHAQPGEAYADRLEPVANVSPYAGPVSGVLDPRTAAALAEWKAGGLRCPVVIEAWEMVGGHRAALRAQNVWLHNEVRSTGLRFFARDVSGYYGAARGADGDRVSVGEFATHGAWSGPRSIPPRHTSPDAEVLPEVLIGRATVALRRSELSTFKVIRAVSEVECVGFLDSINAYDNAFVSMGPCHWTLAIVGERLDRGELPAYLSYLREVDRAAYERTFGAFGARPAPAWHGSGRALWSSTQRKYTATIELEREDGSYSRIVARPEEWDWFRSWHWFYRFEMAARTVPGFQRRMWDMARIRLRDVLSAPWGSGPPARPGMSLTIGDVYTSERAAALLLRWHIRFPGHIVSRGEAAATLRSAWRRASISTSVGAWGDAEEHALIRGVMEEARARGGGLADTMSQVHDWPTWRARRNPRAYRLDPMIGSLSAARGSLQLDQVGLPLEGDAETVGRVLHS